MRRFDWPALIRTGYVQLGLRPQEFWRLTPAELLLLLGRDAGSSPLNRQRLLDLQNEFPDHRRGEDDDVG